MLLELQQAWHYDHLPGDPVPVPNHLSVGYTLNRTLILNYFSVINLSEYTALLLRGTGILSSVITSAQVGRVMFNKLSPPPPFKVGLLNIYIYTLTMHVKI